MSINSSISIKIGDCFYDKNGRPFKSIGIAEVARRELELTACYTVSPVTMICTIRSKEKYVSGYRIKPKALKE